MAKSIRKFLKSFTLIELIIVIAIIAVLGASAFLVLSQWMSKSRDSRKIADLGTIDTAINVSYTSKDVLPTPDNMTNITFGGAKVWELGFFGDEAVNQIGGALTKTPSDPTTKAWYRYAVWNNKYQLGTIIENETFSKYLSRTYAQSYFTKVQGNYNQSIIVAKIGADDVIIPAPSLIIDEFQGEQKNISEEYFWVNKNIYNLGEEQTNTIQVQTLFSGNITDLKDPTNFDNFMNKFADTFSGTVYLKELTPDLDDEKIEEIVSAELKKVSTQNVSVQYLSCDGISHGQTKIFYKENNVSFGQSCDTHQKEFKCENGVWKDGTNNADLDTYRYFTCTVGPASNCEANANVQESESGLSISFNISATEHGLGFNVEQTVNENNGTYKYTLQGNCNNGILESLTLGSPVVQSCDSGYVIQGNNCGENTYWSGDATNGFTFTKLGNVIYPKSCNDLLVSTNPIFKVGNTVAYNGTNFVNGVYLVKPNSNAQFKVYCDMSNEGGGWTMIVGFKGDVLDTSYYDNANVGWSKINGLGTFSSSLNYSASYFSPAYGNVNGDYVRITNGQDRLTWNLTSNNSLYYYINGSGRTIYSAGSSTTGLTFNTDLSYKNSSTITNLSKRWGNPLKILCQDGRSGGRDNAVLGFMSDQSHTGYYCEGFGYPNFGDHGYRYNTRWYSETVGDGITSASTDWRSDSKYYNIWIK